LVEGGSWEELRTAGKGEEKGGRGEGLKEGEGDSLLDKEREERTEEFNKGIE
jgi:hypothetical protein